MMEESQFALAAVIKSFACKLIYMSQQSSGIMNTQFL